MNKLELIEHIFKEQIEEDIALVKLSQGHYAIIDKEDEERINKHKWCLFTQEKKYLSNRYAVRTSYVDGKKTVRLHREVLDVDSEEQVDHINGIGTDNRKSNLRVVNRFENAQNKRYYKSETGYKGVSHKKEKYKGDRYRAYINNRHLGTYNTPEEAALAYNREAVKKFGEYAKLNKVVM